MADTRGDSAVRKDPRRALVTPDGLLKALGALWLVCVLALAVANHDALLGGHHHSGEGVSFFHRHLHGGAHRHVGNSASEPSATDAPAGEHSESPAPAMPKDEDSTHFVADTLTLALEADRSLSELDHEALPAALPSPLRSLACVEHFYLPCAQRPPPNAPRA